MDVGSGGAFSHVFASFRIAVCGLLITPSLFAQASNLGHAREMLQDLNRARVQAANSGKGASFTFGYINQRLSLIEAAVNSDVSSMLASTNRPGCGSLQEELRRTLGHEGQPDPNVASVLCLRSGRALYYVVSYALAGAVTYSRSWIGLFGPTAHGGGYKLRASVENSLPSKTVALAGLPLGGGGQVSFLAYGVNWGDSLNRLTVIAYRYNGREMREIWSRHDLPDGEVQVRGSVVRLTFLSSLLGPGHKPVRQRAESYRLTPSGAVQQSMLSR